MAGRECEATGTIMFSESQDNSTDMLIESLWIEKPYRRQGFGTRLVEDEGRVPTEGTLAHAGCHSIQGQGQCCRQ